MRRAKSIALPRTPDTLLPPCEGLGRGPDHAPAQYLLDHVPMCRQCAASRALWLLLTEDQP